MVTLFSKTNKLISQQPTKQKTEMLVLITIRTSYRPTSLLFHSISQCFCCSLCCMCSLRFRGVHADTTRDQGSVGKQSIGIFYVLDVYLFISGEIPDIYIMFNTCKPQCPKFIGAGQPPGWADYHILSYFLLKGGVVGSAWAGSLSSGQPVPRANFKS